MRVPVTHPLGLLAVLAFTPAGLAKDISLNSAAARDYFVSKGSLGATQIATHGYGEARPIAPNDTAEGRERNRRVEIIAIPVDSGGTGGRAAQ